MPSLPLPRCRALGCLDRAKDKRKPYCDKHRKEQFKERAKFDSDPFYQTPTWRRIAKAHKLANPLCVECLKQELLVKVHTTDHIVAREDGGADYDDANLQSLCRYHHDVKRAAEREARRKLNRC